LRVHPTNPRDLADGNGRPVYLTRSHTWANVQDVRGYDWVTDFPETGGFEAYLKWRQSHNRNFVRLRIPEHAWHAQGAAAEPLAPLRDGCQT
jgi:hypothetical protein